MKSLIKLCETLIGENGCNWDKAQTINSLKKYILEEAEEVALAIDNKDFENLSEELGDLLYVIIFISKVAEKKGIFDIKEIILKIHDKITRRHPHIFIEKKALTKKEIEVQWKKIKLKEKEMQKAGDDLIQ